jgi:hypothetical protein
MRFAQLAMRFAQLAMRFAQPINGADAAPTYKRSLRER